VAWQKRAISIRSESCNGASAASLVSMASMRFWNATRVNVGAILLCGFAIPFNGFREILLHAFAGGVSDAEFKLSYGITVSAGLKMR